MFSNTNGFSALEEVYFTSPLVTNFSYTIINGAGGREITGKIVIPSGATSVTTFLTNGTNYTGILQFDASLASLSHKPESATFCTSSSSMSQYKKGIQVTGQYVDEWMAAYPNGQVVYPRSRNLVKI